MVSSLPSKIVIKKKCVWDWRMPSRGSEVNFMLFPPSALIYSHQGEEKKWIDLCIVGPGKPGGGPASKSHKKTVGSQFRKKSSTDFIDFIIFFFFIFLSCISQFLSKINIQYWIIYVETIFRLFFCILYQQWFDLDVFWNLR